MIQDLRGKPASGPDWKARAEAAERELSERAEVLTVDPANRPPKEHMHPFEWLYWSAIDHGDERMADGIFWLLRDRKFSMETASWQAARRMEEMQRAEAAEKDAARYRWLRDESNANAIYAAAFFNAIDREDFDAQIDAAMRAAQLTE